MRGAIVLVLVLLGAGPATAFDLPWSHAPAPEATAPRPVVSVILADTPATRRDFPGVVTAGSEVALGFQTLGRLSARPVEVGDLVATGDVLAELTPDDLQDNVRAARAAVDAAEVIAQTARSTAERTRDLSVRNVAPVAQLEQAERGQRAAEAGLAQALSELARAEDAEGFARLVAPFDGVISAVHENPGAVVSAGTPIVTLSNTESREAVIDLPEAALPFARRGTTMMIWQEASPDIRSTGQVSRIEPLADAATRTRRVWVTIDRPGGFRLNTLIRAQRSGDDGLILRLPVTALIAGKGNAPAVWVVQRPDGAPATVERRAVTTGTVYDGVADIASGLSAGEEVVIRGVNSLKDGQSVGRSVAP
ncbi:MAG: efflux RND transporter periplasmic adaptor subunit [Paracoccus sp. (in: a-proteobacteria)]|nr:efflux RND transporter periplasmic adaptor subunit [Paracoccus sp. (in: a-proteobacteria)]